MLGKNCQRKRASVKILKKKLKGRHFIVKNFWVSSLCEKVGIHENFDIRYENGCFFHKIYPWQKQVENRQSEKMKNKKTCVFDGPSILNHKFPEIDF